MFYTKRNKKQFLKDLVFRCGMTHLNYPLKHLGKSFKLLKELSKTEMNHHEVGCINYLNKKDEFVDYVKQDVFCTAFSYARCCTATDEITGFSMKDSLSAP